MGWFPCDRCGWMTPTGQLPYVCESEQCRDAVKESWFDDDEDKAREYASSAGLVVGGAKAFRGVWAGDVLGSAARRTLPLRFRSSGGLWGRVGALWGASHRPQCPNCEQRTGTRCCPQCWRQARPDLVEVDAESPSVIGVLGFKGAGKSALIQAMLYSVREAQQAFTTIGAGPTAEADYAAMFGEPARRTSTAKLPQQTSEMPPPWTIREFERGLVGVIYDMPGEQVQEFMARVSRGDAATPQDRNLEQALLRMNRLTVVVPWSGTYADHSALAATLAFLGARKRATSKNGGSFDRVAISVVKLDQALQPDELKQATARNERARGYVWGSARRVYVESKVASTGQAAEARVFGVSALGRGPRKRNEQEADAPLEPQGVDEPLRWLIDPDASNLGAIVEE